MGWRAPWSLLRAADTLPVTSWNLVQFSDDDATPVADPSQLTSGYYTTQDPGSGNFLFRNQVEDRSLNPRYVGLWDPSGDRTSSSSRSSLTNPPRLPSRARAGGRRTPARAAPYSRTPNGTVDFSVTILNRIGTEDPSRLFIFSFDLSIRLFIFC